MRAALIKSSNLLANSRLDLGGVTPVTAKFFNNQAKARPTSNADFGKIPQNSPQVDLFMGESTSKTPHPYGLRTSYSLLILPLNIEARASGAATGDTLAY